MINNIYLHLEKIKFTIFTMTTLLTHKLPSVRNVLRDRGEYLRRDV